MLVRSIYSSNLTYYPYSNYSTMTPDGYNAWSNQCNSQKDRNFCVFLIWLESGSIIAYIWYNSQNRLILQLLIISIHNSLPHSELQKFWCHYYIRHCVTHNDETAEFMVIGHLKLTRIWTLIFGRINWLLQGNKIQGIQIWHF